MNVYQEIQKNKWKTAVLMSVFIAVVLFAGWWFGEFYIGDPYSGLVIATIVSLFMTTVSYFAGDKVALATAGAQEISREDNAYVWNLVENLALTAGMPMPRVYVIDDPALNAFATGRSPEHASIAFTTGIINALENEELEGVAAHELSHVKNYDVRIMTIVVVLVGIITLLGDMMFRMHWFGGGRRRSNNNSDGKAQLILLVVGLVFVILSPIIAQLIKLAISRRREYLADASAVLLTRYADGLAGALEKIAATETHGVNQLQRANHATAHLYLANPFKEGGFSKLFSTHPPIAERIAKLRAMGGSHSA